MDDVEINMPNITFAVLSSKMKSNCDRFSQLHGEFALVISLHVASKNIKTEKTYFAKDLKTSLKNSRLEKNYTSFSKCGLNILMNENNSKILQICITFPFKRFSDYCLLGKKDRINIQVLTRCIII